MKVFGFFTLLLATTASAAAVISTSERRDWESCTNNLLDSYRRGDDGDKTSCNMWDCLHQKASQYSRGGGIAALSNILTPACLPIKLNPFTWGGHSPPPSSQETQDWRACTRDLIVSFDTRSNGNKAACRMWGCLQSNISKYNRGSILTKVSKLLTPVCDIGSILPIGG